METPAPSQLPELHQPTYLEFEGEGWSFARLTLKNTVLSILSFGFYFPWARTHRRKYLWAHTAFLDQRFEYLGTPREILLGYLKMLGLVGVIILGEVLIRPVFPDFYPVFRILYSLSMILLIPWAVYRSRQYILSRTRWSGIRFAMNPSASHYIVTYMWTWFVTVLTFGLFTPWRLHYQHKAFIENAHIGNQKLEYNGDPAAFAKTLFKGFIFTVASLGLYYFWFKAEVLNYLIAHTRFQDRPLVSRLEGGHLFSIFFLQWLLVPLTAGLAIPWVSLFKLRTILENVGIESVPDLSKIGQTPFRSGSGFAEEAADFMDAGGFGL